MFMHVKLLNGYPATLTYQIPSEWPTHDLVGSLVKVPLQKRTEIALVEEVFKEFPSPVSFTIREAYARELLPCDTLYRSFIRKLSSYYSLSPLYFYQRVHSFLKEKEHATISHPERAATESSAYTLTEEQQAIVSTITPVIHKPQYYPALLQGVTGSGKTEVYKKLIIEAHKAGKSVLFLCPEVSLAVQFSTLFKKQLPHFIALYSFHSATSVIEKRSLWKALFTEQPFLIVGVHLPIMIPIPNLGLILIDEEHETGFQEKKHPKIYTKEAALLRAQLYSIPIILGSATPSLTSLHKVHHKEWHFFELKKRFAGSFPTITFIKLSNKQRRKNFWISCELEKALRDRLAKKEQTIIFLNRRGYSFFIQCKECGFIPTCLQCSVSLTLHQDNKLLCHYCNYTLLCPPSCSSCKAPATSFIKKGIGTQQIVTMLEKLFPEARIARADVDTTVNKRKWQEILQNFEAGALDILVGTQTITKGYHFPGVTLVGVLWADINLSIPFYNAAETSLQQLIQVAGRAGRQTQESTVIVQALIDHPIFKYLHEKDYAQFYEYEIKHRQELSYPPCIRLAEIELKHSDERVLEQEADQVAQVLQATIVHLKQPVTLLGPAQPPVHKVKNTYSRKIYLKSPSIQELIKLYRSINKKLYTSSLFFTPNPLS